jgi:predicted ribosome quality control (RQC) complex YloA/Tae2 family protein
MADPKPLRIPYDSLVLSAVAAELQVYVGGKVQRISQPDEDTIGFALYAGGAEAYLLLSCDPQFARAHFITKRPANQPQPPQFCSALRSRLDGAKLVSVQQKNFDRILHMDFLSAEGEHTLIAELMGKHSNLIFIDGAGKIVGAAKWIGRSKSTRPIQAGAKYQPPPFPPRASLLQALPGDDLREFTGASPFLLKLIEAMGPKGLQRIQEAVVTRDYQPVLSVGHGAYPISVASLGLKELSRASISIALEQHYDVLIPETEMAALRASLVSQLNRVILARDVAIADLRQAEEMGGRAPQMQLHGELILAYGAGLDEGASLLEAYDYEGKPVTIKLDPELNYKENANRFFDKAKRAKGRMGTVRDQLTRLTEDKLAIEGLLQRVQDATRLGELEDLRDEARKKRWLHSQPTPTRRKEDRPYEGHKVRELMGPGGWPVLYGENAESNDYLTLRVAKPNDWWLHVRGGISAHVVIPTKNAPDKVSREVIQFAAQIAVQNSPSKHSGYVPVDYTLKKYVRKPRGAPKGTALYTHEKTLHIEGK